ncbi:TonB-dependent receptor, partial [Azospirillum sp. B4]|uniref:TonB-dependent receptor n=1 Tax=Azospirillum sp. B4 TaxID=95605 RepID=UPI0005CB1CC4
GEKVYIPGGADWRSTTFDRKRTGLYGALQWQPNNDLEFHVRAFRSRYDNQWVEYGAFVQNGADALPAADATNIYGSNGALVYTSDLRAYNWNAINQTYGENPMAALTDTALQRGHSVTSDYSGGMTWTPTNDLKISSDLQFVESNAASTRYDLYLWSYIPGFSLDTRSGIPKITSTSTTSATDASNYGWYATMDHREEHVGRELAWNADADYRVSETGFLRALTGGVRVTRRTEMDADSGYNWTALTPYWNGASAVTYASTTPASYVTLNNFSNFFRGMTTLPSALYFPSLSMVECYPDCLSSLQKEITGNTVNASTFKPYQRNNQTETNESAYLMAKFTDDSHLFAPMSGSIGVRLVNTQNSYNGYVALPSQQVVWNGSTGYLGGGYEKRDGSNADFAALPSLNLQFLLTPQIHWRIALGQALNRPSFSQMNPGTQLSAVTDSTNNITGWAGAYGGNPNLKAEKSDQADTSLEWYGDDGSEAHLALFYKAVHNYITTGVFAENYAVTMPDGTTTTQTFQVTEPFNGSLAIAKGFEIGGQKFFDFLPHPFDGFGLQANFTYVYSKAPSDIAYDMDGKAITGLPMDGMSRYSYNLIGMYEKGPYSLRLAYNWRSKYLLATTANGTTGSTTITAHGIQYAYALPVYNDDYGQLDGSIEYKVDDHFTVSFEATNLTDEVTHTIMGTGSQAEGRSWFVNDRRYMLGIRFAY